VLVQQFYAQSISFGRCFAALSFNMRPDRWIWARLLSPLDPVECHVYTPPAELCAPQIQNQEMPRSPIPLRGCFRLRTSDMKWVNPSVDIPPRPVPGLQRPQRCACGPYPPQRDRHHDRYIKREQIERVGHQHQVNRSDRQHRQGRRHTGHHPCAHGFGARIVIGFLDGHPAAQH
jgi:hypothetical protein